MGWYPSTDAGFCVPIKALLVRQAFDSYPTHLGDGPVWALMVLDNYGPHFPGRWPMAMDRLMWFPFSLRHQSIRFSLHDKLIGDN